MARDLFVNEFSSKGKHYKKQKEFYVNIKGYDIFALSDRYLNFIEHGCTCKHCGLKGSYYAIERDLKRPFWDNGYRLNLYGIDKNGNEVMLTKDHILPKSRGGEDDIENYQPLCSCCNERKGNQYEEIILEQKQLLCRA